MVPLFKQFMALNGNLELNNKKYKKFPIEKFDPENIWSVDRWWSHEEKVELGIDKEVIVLNLDEFIQKTNEVEERIHDLNEELRKL